MRTAVTGLPVAHPLAERLPGILRDDDFVVRMTNGLDDVLAPVFAALDSLEAYLDPALAPDDFLAWLAGWLAIELDEGWTEPQRRAAVARAVALHRWRGTRRGLAEQVSLLAGGADVEVTDSGGCSWSAESSGQPPGSSPPVVRVTVRRRAGSGRHHAAGAEQHPDLRRLREAVAAAVPAHVRSEVEVVER